MSQLWYYADTNSSGHIGPLTLEKLKSILANLPNASDVLVWREGMAEWQKAGGIPDFREGLIAPPPLPSGFVNDQMPTWRIRWWWLIFAINGGIGIVLVLYGLFAIICVYYRGDIEPILLLMLFIGIMLFAIPLLLHGSISGEDRADRFSDCGGIVQIVREMENNWIRHKKVEQLMDGIVLLQHNVRSDVVTSVAAHRNNELQMFDLTNPKTVTMHLR